MCMSYGLADADCTTSGTCGCTWGTGAGWAGRGWWYRSRPLREMLSSSCAGEHAKVIKYSCYMGNVRETLVGGARLQTTYLRCRMRTPFIPTVSRYQCLRHLVLANRGRPWGSVRYVDRRCAERQLGESL